MKFILIISIIYLSATSLASPLNDSDDDGEYCFKDLGCFDNAVMQHTNFLPQSPEHIKTKFFAYDRYNEKDFIIDPYDSKTFDILDKEKKIVIYVHGWLETHKSHLAIDLKNSLLKYKSNEIGNVIMVDWHRGSIEINYAQSAANTELVGRQIAHLCNQIHNATNFDVKKFHLIGFSLGGQTVGFAGKWSQKAYNWKYSHITGLDAAGPEYEKFPGSYLTKDDADFVDAVHTSIGGEIIKGELGMTIPYAHVDFYPNGGHVKQPYCHPGSALPCSHQTSIRYYEASISAAKECKFFGEICENLDHFFHDECQHTDVVFGYDSIKSKHPQDKYYIKVSDHFPFCDI